MPDHSPATAVADVSSGGGAPVDPSAEPGVGLGATWDGTATTFAVWSSVATAVDLSLFDDEGRESRVPMARAMDGTWRVRVTAGPGQRYGYRVDGPWDPSFAGPLCDPDRLLLDPWARAIHGAPSWDPALFPAGRGGRAPAGRRAQESARRASRDTAPFVPISIVVDPTFDWTGDRPPHRAMAESVICELHVKGFTRRHPAVPPSLRGTYLGLAHPAALGHLVGLGVTAVELLPVSQFASEPKLAALGLENYWGYNPIGFAAPHAGYAVDAFPGAAVHELKTMVRALHSAGLEVILDIVFNHTAEGGLDGPVLSLKGLDNAAFYRLSRTDPNIYQDVTGCGNALDARSPAVQRLVLDSLRRWVEEYHVDGFRFDLAATLGREADGFDPDHPLLAAIRADPVVGAVKLIAEPWDLGPDGYQAGRFPAPWSEWNDAFRAAALDAWNGSRRAGAELARRLAGSPDRYRPGGRPPTASINYVTAHDGMTLSDLVTFERKRNGANGEAGLDGSDHERSSNHGVEGLTDDPAVQWARLRTRRNLLATLLLAQGVPMLLAGDELGRTQSGNNNAYCQDNETSWLDWDAADPAFVAFVRELIALRAARPALRQPDWQEMELPHGDQPVPAAWQPIGDDGLILRLGVGPTFGRDDGPGMPTQHCIVVQPAEGRRAVRLPSSPGVAGWRVVLETTATDPFPAWGRTLVPGRMEMVDGPGVLLLDGVAS